MEQRDGNILNLLYKQGPLSNQELATQLGISSSAVSNATRRLLEGGAVVVRDADDYSGQVQPGSRRKRTLGINPEYGYAVVVEIDFDYIILHKLRYDLESVYSKRVPVSGMDRDVILETVEEELRSLGGRRPDEGLLSEEELRSRGSGGADGRLCGIGFCMPGQVDHTRNVAIHNTRIDNWNNVDFNRFATYSDTIAVENVANAVALGEHVRGAARGIEDFIVLRVGNGAGMGIMIGGRLHRGRNFAAGEAGHVIVDESSRATCSCGNRGCLETYISRRAVMRELKRLKESEVPSDILTDLESHHGDGIFRVLGTYYEAGDKVAYLVMEELAHKLGLAAANFVQILAPERVVLSGPISQLGDRFLEMVQQVLRRYQLPWLAPVPLVYGQDFNLSAAQGMAMLLFRKHWAQ